MQIKINDKQMEAAPGTTLLQAARSAGFDIPSLCSAEGAVHKPSCMVCVVKNAATGEMLPSCSTAATEGMSISTDSEDVLLARRLSLELLLSDHRADCDAPCGMVCPHGLDIELMLKHWDEGSRDKAGSVVAEAFDLPRIGCDDCKAPCEKVCRRRMTAGEPVEIRDIVRVLAVGASPVAKKHSEPKNEKYQSLPGKFTPEEARRINESVRSGSGCLHCACRGRSKCRLRTYATAEGIKRSRYGLSSALPVMSRSHIVGKVWFEPSKCIRCGLCVYNTVDGFTFSGRGFSMQVVVPDESRAGIDPAVADLCPTGALYYE